MNYTAAAMWRNGFPIGGKMLNSGRPDHTEKFYAAYMRNHFALHHWNGSQNASLVTPG